MDKNSEQSCEESSSPSETSQLSPSLLNITVSIIKDAIIDLEIFEKLHNLPKIDADFKYTPLEEKFGSTVIKPEDDIHCILVEKVEDKTLIKLQQNRSYVEYFLKELLDELKETQTTDRFEKLLIDHKEWLREEEKLIGERKKLILKEKKLESELERLKIQHYLSCNEKDETIGSLKDEYENLLREYKIKEDYVEKWEESRLEQRRTKANQREEELENNIRDLTNKIEREKRVHKEIVAYNNEIIQDHYNAIDNWTKKYAEDIKSMEEKIASKKNSKMTQYLKITAITALFKDRQREMRAYEEQKELERQKAAEVERINAQATKIQAWWRGVMVRRKLGPYKVKKPKPKGKGKSGK